MEIIHEAEVVDKNGRLLGTVDYVMRNSWTGEVSKFIVNRKAPARDLFLTPEDVLESTDTVVRLKAAFDETGEDS